MWSQLELSVTACKIPPIRASDAINGLVQQINLKHFQANATNRAQFCE